MNNHLIVINNYENIKNNMIPQQIKFDITFRNYVQQIFNNYTPRY